jgi:hypothetical protein
MTDTLETMKAEGFRGPDASLNESLVEYGLAWKDDNGDLLFYYRCPYQEKRFQWGRVRLGTDPFKEWDWALRGDKADGFFSFIGGNADEWRELPLCMQVFDLVNHWGTLEIFGESYTEGFRIAGLEW